MRKFLLLFLTITLSMVFMACGTDSTYNQKETLKRAYEKSITGAPLTKQEERELQSYKKWEKEYDAQQYNNKYYGY